MNTINSLPIHNANGTIIIETMWSEDSVGVTLFATDSRQGYSGTLSKSELIRTAETLELNVTDFMTDVENSLCTPNGLPNFIYLLSNDQFKFCKVTNEKIQLTYGTINLVASSDAVAQILINSIKSNDEKQTQINALRLELSEMNETYESMKLDLEKCVGEKVQMENILLAKFAALLNAKKDKIAELEKMIKKQRSSTVVVDDFESDGSDSDLDYSSSQSYGRETSLTIASSTGNESATLVPKRRNIRVANETVTVEEGSTKTSAASIAEGTKPAESEDIYNLETEVMICDM